MRVRVISRTHRGRNQLFSSSESFVRRRLPTWIATPTTRPRNSCVAFIRGIQAVSISVELVIAQLMHLSPRQSHNQVSFRRGPPRHPPHAMQARVGVMAAVVTATIAKQHPTTMHCIITAASYPAFRTAFVPVLDIVTSPLLWLTLCYFFSCIFDKSTSSCLPPPDSNQ